MFTLYQITPQAEGTSTFNKIAEGDRGKLGPLMARLLQARKIRAKLYYGMYDINGAPTSIAY